MALQLLSPAKINLFLDVISKRPDGFHNIFTVFERIDLFDRITLEVTKNGIRLETDNEELPRGRDNIAYKAAELFLKNFKIKKGVYIKVEKHIPIAAGLGGGSSNAATVLLGMNRLFGLSLGKEEIMPLAKKVGSDVPFFTEETSFAIGEGRGDIITPLKTNKRFWHILVCPNIRVYTKEIYNELEEKKNNVTANFTDNYNKKSNLLNIWEKLNLTKNTRDSINTLFNLSSCFLYNKLESIVEDKIKEIRQVKIALENYGVKPMMSGSGPTVFGFVNLRKEAEIIRDKLASQYNWQIFLTKTY
ncbi:MAG: 4-(cytidine 5'-diphospho)-2-C-methyl-D-erythritol kinase [Candidatus Omnitrophica bacterium]|nr:4-(cytidine 5'-diphospho)-2-C-methyl-D-erythritol kinase [Candidatus Omnitrophota bacterium]